MEAEEMYITRNECEYHRGEFKEDLHCLKMDFQRTNDMIVDEVKGLRQDLNKANEATNELMAKITELLIRRETDKEHKTSIHSWFKWIITALLSILAILVAAGYILK